MTNLKYDWLALKKEFLEGNYSGPKDFLLKKGIKITNLKQTANWQKEKKEMKEKAIEATKSKIVQDEVESASDIRKRQANLARFMQLKGASSLQTLKPSNVDEARKLVVSGMEQERSALGLERDSKSGQTLTQINILGPKTNLDRLVEELDYEGVLKLIAELRREKSRRSGESATDGSSREIEEGEVV